MWTRIADHTFSPLLCLRPNGRHRPAGRPQPKPRPAETTVCGVVLCVRNLTGPAGLASCTTGPACCPSLRTIIALQPLRLPLSNRPRASWDSVKACITSPCREAQWGGQGQGYNVRARCSLSVLLCLFFYSSGRRARSCPSAVYHAYSLPALGPPPRLLAPGIETIEMRPRWPSSVTSYPTGGSFSSSFSSALFS